MLFGAIGFLLGSAIGSELPSQFVTEWNWRVLVWWWLTWLLAVLLLTWIWHHPLITDLVALSVFLVIGSSYAIHTRHQLARVTVPLGQPISLTGRIRNFPRLIGTKQRFVIETSQFGRAVGIQIETSREPAYERDTRLTLMGKLLEPPTNPDFDYRYYLEGQGIIALLVRPDSVVIQETARPLWQRLNKLRGQIATSLQQVLPEPAASLALGLTLGIPPTIDPSLTTALKVTNLTHLAAVSGQNLSLTVMIIFGLIRRVWLRLAIFLSLLLLGLYVGLVGGEPSVARAATLVTFFVGAPLVGRPVEPLRLLLATAVCMTLINPLIITRDVGFQLSFAAFAGIVLLAPLLTRHLTWLPAWLAEIVSTILAATLAVLPVQLVVFGTVSFVGPLANFLVGFVVSFAMITSFGLALLTLINTVLGRLAAPLVYFPLNFLAQVALRGAAWPLANESLTLPPWLSTVLITAESLGFLVLSRFLVRFPWLTIASRSTSESERLR